MARYVIYGAGAVGGVIGGLLHRTGRDTVLIARGPHAEAMRRNGLRLETPDETFVLDLPVATEPSEVEWRDDDVAVLAMKTQDTDAALDALSSAAPPSIAVVCAQNGVANERMALRRFPNVYGITVMLPATHLEPGVVQANSWPTAGCLDVGRYPSGVDDTARAIAAELTAAGFDSRPVSDVMRWKHTKLLMNLGNAAQAACGLDDPNVADVVREARREGVAVLRAAGIPFASREEDAERRGDILSMRPIDGRERGGGSSWQSLARGTGSIEADYLNGEIVLLGREHGVPTPVNEMLQRVARQMARDRMPPGSLPVDALAAG